MTLYSLEKMTDGIFLSWVDTGDTYELMELPGKKFMGNFSKNSFSGYEHFAGVIGKFNPYTVMFEEPVEVSDNPTSQELSEVYNRLRASWVK